MRPGDGVWRIWLVVALFLILVAMSVAVALHANTSETSPQPSSVSENEDTQASFLQRTLHKIERVRKMVERANSRCEVEVDGGVDETTAPFACAAGADVFVAGSSIFGDVAGVAAAMNQLRTAIASRNGALVS